MPESLLSRPDLKIVLSYRRSDAPGTAGWIFERLTQHDGNGKVFRDIDSIPFGVDFRKHIRKELDQCDALIAIIGPRWLGEDEHPRIHDETDFVRFEIETALQREIPVVLVLVEGATMPKPDQLPETLRDLAFYNAAPVDSGRDFQAHVNRLIRSLDRLLNFRNAQDETREGAEQERLAYEQEGTNSSKDAGSSSKDETPTPVMPSERDDSGSPGFWTWLIAQLTGSQPQEPVAQG